MNSTFMKVKEVAEELDVSMACAYKVVHKLNEELKQKNFITVSGRVSRQYFHERVYGTKPPEGKE